MTPRDLAGVPKGSSTEKWGVKKGSARLKQTKSICQAPVHPNSGTELILILDAFYEI